MINYKSKIIRFKCVLLLKKNCLNMFYLNENVVLVYLCLPTIH